MIGITRGSVAVSTEDKETLRIAIDGDVTLVSLDAAYALAECLNFVLREIKAADDPEDVDSDIWLGS